MTCERKTSVRHLVPRSLAALALLALVVSVPAAGQIAPLGPFRLQGELDLSNPGARSLGIAGAFLARTDDTTAAYINPAGLIHLRFNEIALEGRQRSQDVEVFDPNGGRTVLDSSGGGVSFAAVSYPLGRITLALFLHDLATLDVSTQGAGFQAADLDLGIGSVGLAAGFKIMPWFRVGVALVGYRSNITGASIGLGGASETVTSEETELGYTLGYQLDLAEDWSLGFVFRDAPGFDVTIESAGETRIAEYVVPDIVGLGLGWQATHRLVASLDYNLVKYSATLPDQSYEGGRFVVPDARELRLGFEYTVWEYETSPAFRVGVWEEPAHRVRWKPSAKAPSESPRVEFPEGEDEIHVSLGAGLVIGRFQIDVGADLADSSDTYSLSLVFFP